jgi:cytoskeletal protein RodZ
LQQTGIGPTLREARLRQGKSIEEASRDTRIRADYLQALERESFGAFVGDVYARGFLRTYSGYLGLDSNEMLTEFNRQFGPPRPTLPAPPPGPVRGEKTAHPQLHPLRRHHPSWRFLIAVAIVVIAILAAAGLFRSRSTPPASTPASTAAPSLGPGVVVGVRATRSLTAVLTVDGKSKTYPLEAGEGVAVTGTTTVVVSLSTGGRAVLTVNGTTLGMPGKVGTPYVATFTPESFRRTPSNQSPSP